MNKFRVAFLGRTKSVLRFQRIISSSQGAQASSLHPVGAFCTDSVGTLDIPLPLYESWQELLRDQSPNMLFLLDSDPELKLELRRNLPAEVELIEEQPAQLLCASILNQRAFVRKTQTRQLFLESLIEALPAAAIIFDKFGHVLYWNDVCAQMTSVPKEEVVGKKIVSRAFYDADRPLLGQLILETLETDPIREYYPDPELEIHPISQGVQLIGTVFTRLDVSGYFQIIAQRIVSQGEIIGSVELIQDLSSIHILEEQVQKQQEQLKTIISHLPFPLIHTALNGKLFFANKAAQQNLFQEGTHGEGTGRQNIFDYLPELKPEFKHHFLNSLEAIPPQTMPNQSQTFDVHISDQEWAVTCLAMPEQGVTWTLIWILHNISSKEEQDRLNAAVAMAGAISHELSQPLTAIINSAQLLSNTSLDDKHRFKRHLDIISREGERVLDLYQKLRNISKVKLTSYLDMQILDLDKSADLNLTINPPKQEK